MVRKVVFIFLAIVNVGLLTLLIQRMSMDYNENGVHFEDGVTYDNDALLVYKVALLLSLLSTLGVAIVWRIGRASVKKDITK